MSDAADEKLEGIVDGEAEWGNEITSPGDTRPGVLDPSTFGGGLRFSGGVTGQFASFGSVS